MEKFSSLSCAKRFIIFSEDFARMQCIYFIELCKLGWWRSNNCMLYTCVEVENFVSSLARSFADKALGQTVYGALRKWSTRYARGVRGPEEVFPLYTVRLCLELIYN